MSNIQDDIKQLRSAFEYELISQDLEQPVNRVCDALEKAIRALEEIIKLHNFDRTLSYDSAYQATIARTLLKEWGVK